MAYPACFFFYFDFGDMARATSSGDVTDSFEFYLTTRNGEEKRICRRVAGVDNARLSPEDSLSNDSDVCHCFR